MIRMLARISVADFDEFAAGFSLAEHVAMRANGGVLADSIQHDVADPTRVLVIHDFVDLATAQAYAASSVLHRAMRVDGVQGQAPFEFYVLPD